MSYIETVGKTILDKKEESIERVYTENSYLLFYYCKYVVTSLNISLFV